MKTIEAVEKAYGRTLPADYKAFVRGIDDYAERYFKDDDWDDDFPGRPWFLWGVGRLGNPLVMRDVGTEPYFKALMLYTKMYADLRSSHAVSSPEGDLPVERVAGGFAFGQENGDYIYMDPSDGFSVWIYYHDRGDVQWTSPSFSAWFTESEDAS